MKQFVNLPCFVRFCASVSHRKKMGENEYKNRGLSPEISDNSL